VIPVVYAQQKQMLDNNTHICPDRIISLEQPHVRPINRAKCPNPTEFEQKLHLSVVDGYTFLEQTSWNNFNESTDPQAAVEDYFRKFGCYPTAVLADKIYQIRANKLYCKQMYKDSCLYNAIEGRNRNAKRRFGLDLIMAKLDETAKTEVALDMLAMNASCRLACWLVRFFRRLLSPPGLLVFSRP